MPDVTSRMAGSADLDPDSVWLDGDGLQGDGDLQPARRLCDREDRRRLRALSSETHRRRPIGRQVERRRRPIEDRFPTAHQPGPAVAQRNLRVATEQVDDQRLLSGPSDRDHLASRQVGDTKGQVAPAGSGRIDRHTAVRAGTHQQLLGRGVARQCRAMDGRFGHGQSPQFARRSGFGRAASVTRWSSSW